MLDSTDYLVFGEVIAPFAVVALAPYVCGKQLAAANFEKAMKWVFWSAIGAQIGSLYLLAYFGSNLLHARYLITIVIPAVILASIGVVRLPLYLASVPLAYWLLFIAGSFFIDFNVNGSFSGVGIQDWRKAVTCVNQFVRSEPETVVLYRSGFVEEDNLLNGSVSAATLSPLRSPGRHPVRWNLIQLTYSWDKPERDSYFSRVVEPAIQHAESFFYVTCTRCFTETRGQYTYGLISWVEKRFPGRFQMESIPVGRGITCYALSVY